MFTTSTLTTMSVCISNPQSNFDRLPLDLETVKQHHNFLLLPAPRPLKLGISQSVVLRIVELSPYPINPLSPLPTNHNPQFGTKSDIFGIAKNKLL